MGIPENKKIPLERKFKKGKLNLITDVPGVRVGQVTLNDDEKNIHTGVTTIIPGEGNLFRNKVTGGVAIINGFGKSAGLIQIEELGTIETPIVMTNTFAVGTALNALTKYMMDENPEIGVSTGTVNCIVTECNDGGLNDIRGMHIKEQDVLNSVLCADKSFREGAEGAGTGMICMGLKGGIGSSSRIIHCDGKDYTIGVILLSNFGKEGNLKINGLPVQKNIAFNSEEKGSCIIVTGTDLPLNERQLKRVAKRTATGLARTGSFFGNGSGDIAIAFSNGNRIPHFSDKKIFDVKMFNDSKADEIFEAVAEATEEAVVSSLYHGKTITGIRNCTVKSLMDSL